MLESDDQVDLLSLCAGIDTIPGNSGHQLVTNWPGDSEPWRLPQRIPASLGGGMHRNYLTTTVGALLVATLLSLGAILVRSVEASEGGEAAIVYLRVSMP
jgi:hypothetical protein